MFAGLLDNGIITPTDPVHISYPVGCLLDIPTANSKFHQTDRGNWVLMGGYSDLDSVVGPGHSWKSEQIFYPPLTVLGHFPSSGILAYDTENSMSYDRLESRKHLFEGLEDFSFVGEMYSKTPRFILTQSAKIDGDVFFEQVKMFAKERTKAAKQLLRTTPIPNHVGDLIKAYPPAMFIFDSLSGMKFTTIQEKIVDQNAVGESGGNTVFMKDGAAKTQLLMQLPDLPARAGIHISMTAHIGNFIQIDPYAPKPATLTHQKNGTKHKGVPEKFSFYNTHLKDVFNVSPLINPSDKMPLYPNGLADKEKSSDLMLVTIINSRNKYGPTGVTFPWVVSQREGVLAYMTEFNYIKNVGKNYGIVGNDRSYALAFCPTETLSRTTVRGKLANDRKLRTAVKLQADLLQMYNIWNFGEDPLYCDPETLYNDIKALGYDWDVLLQTRYWWSFREEEKLQRYNELTIMDLLMMRQGQYHPYWLEADKKTIKKEWLLAGYTK
jgi:hypothetical protein